MDQNRLVPVLLGWLACREPTINALSVNSEEKVLDEDNCLVLAALGLIALDRTIQTGLRKSLAGVTTISESGTVSGTLRTDSLKGILR